MKLLTKAGFTIIETILFLGITGLLVMGVLVGTGTSINIQRYRDSIVSLQSFIQQQFSDVSNVNNERNSNWFCDKSSTITQSGSGTARGQSDCAILGRFITTTNGSHSLLVKSVVGYIPPGSVAALNDIDAFKQYNIKVSPITSDNYDIEWNTFLVTQGSNTAASFSMLILHSPLSGVVRTFINPKAVVADHDVATLVSQSALTQPVTMCVSNKGLFGGTTMAVTVSAGATSASGVETLGDTSKC